MASSRPEPDIVSSIRIERPPEDIWNFVVEVSTDTQWRETMIDARWISDPPYGIGSDGLHVVKGVGDWPWKVTALQKPRIMSWLVTGGRFEGSHGAYRIEPEADGSRFFMDMRFKRTIIISLLVLVMKGRMKRQNAADLENLKALMEA